jgi:hypothetical protein
MTDFLTRLAERTLGLTPRVQPLLASRYAPEPAVQFSSDTLDEEQASSPTPPADPMQAPTPRFRESSLSALESVPSRETYEAVGYSASTEAVAKTSLDSEKAAALDVHEPAPLRAVSKTHSTPAAIEAVAETSVNSEVKDASSAERDASPSVELLRGRQSQPVRVAALASPERQAEAAAADPFLAPAVPAALNPAALNIVLHANRSAPHHEEPQVAPLLPSPLPQERLEVTSGERGVFDRPAIEGATRRADVVRPLPVVIADHRETHPPANESAPPVIRVTIGRVEVRAIMPQTPAVERPAPARTSPVLSLDEYLKQHSGRQR